ncbi:hypothetical protein [Helicobacter pullorum]|nr:hypothetical protein [Helicobacter pullorum]
MISKRTSILGFVDSSYRKFVDFKKGKKSRIEAERAESRLW